MTEKIRLRPQTVARRAELVRIAFRLIAAGGLEGFRTRDVAAAASIDTGTLHYHFPSKEALIRAVVEYLSDEFRSSRSRSVTHPSNAAEELHDEVFDVVSRAREAPEQLVTMLDFIVRASRDPAVGAILARNQRSWNDALESLFLRGVEQRLFRADIDPTIEANLLRGQLLGLAIVSLTNPERAHGLASAFVEHLTRSLSR